MLCEKTQIPSVSLQDFLCPSRADVFFQLLPKKQGVRGVQTSTRTHPPERRAAVPPLVSEQQSALLVWCPAHSIGTVEHQQEYVLFFSITIIIIIISRSWVKRLRSTDMIVGLKAPCWTHFQIFIFPSCTPVEQPCISDNLNNAIEKSEFSPLFAATYKNRCFC